MTAERRQFERVPFHIEVTLQHNGDIYPAELLDISLQGALINIPENTPKELPGGSELHVILHKGEAAIHMEVNICHKQDSRFGLHCTSIDDESMHHLTTLLAYNLDDSDGIDREFENF